jgi:hypothetical protein
MQLFNSTKDSTSATASLLPRPPVDNLVVAFRFASLTAPAGAVDNRQADTQVTPSLPTRFGYALTRPSGLALVRYRHKENATISCGIKPNNKTR